MIKINNKIISPKFFTDSTMKIELELISTKTLITVTWAFDSESELILLQYIMMYLNDKYPSIPKHLIMPYVPNARMDRVTKDTEVHTLKYFCKIINSLGFERVLCLDPHSDVTATLLDHFDIDYSSRIVKSAINDVISKIERYWDINYNDIILAYPDKGSVHRYDPSKILCFPVMPYVYGEKKRDWNTREILSYSLINPANIDIKGKTVLICDDIISTGGTITEMVSLLKKEEVNKIFIYCSHLENEIIKPNNKLNELLHNDIACLFTIDSIYTGHYLKEIDIPTYLEQSNEGFISVQGYYGHNKQS